MELKFFIEIGMIVIAIYLEVRLSLLKRFWLGLIPIILVAAVFLSLTVWAYDETNNYHRDTVSEKLPNGYTAKITFELDKNDRIVASTDAEITDESGEILELINSSEEDYKEIQEYIAPKYTVKDNIAQLSDIKNGVHNGGETMSRSGYLYLLIIVEVPLILIYGIRRYQFRRKRQKEELREMSIKLL